MRSDPRRFLSLRLLLKFCLILVVVGLVYAVYRLRPKPINVVLLTLDTTRADRLGCYGYASGLTPHLDKIARDGVLFERAYTTVPLTLPSHASIMTGLYPPEHGLRVNGRDTLPSEPTTLAGLLQDNGYSTAGFVSSFVLDKKFRLNRGFQEYQRVADYGRTDETGTASSVTDEALKWLKEKSNTPFFCWVHYIDPHADYDSHPSDFGTRFADSPYDGELAYVDTHVGRILRFLSEQGLDKNTLVIVVGDHGEAFGEHGERTHGTLVYNTTMQVPLIVRFPKSQHRSRQVGTPVSLVDVFPTVAEVLGVNSPEPVSGTSLLKTIAEKEDANRALYFESLAMTPRGWAPQQGVIRERWKFVRSTQSELFDLHADAGELKNRFGSEPLVVSELQELLTITEKSFRRRTGQGAELSPSERGKIGALGYAADAQTHVEASDAPDVKLMLPYYYRTIDAELLLDDSPRLTEAAVRKVVEERPDFEMAWSVLGTALLRQDRVPEAVSALVRAIHIDPHSSRAHATLGKIRRKQNQLADAETHFEAALRNRPDLVSVRIELAEVLLQANKTDQSVSQFRTAIESAPDNPDSHVGLATALLKAGQKGEARNELQEALRLSPESTTARELLSKLDKSS